MRLANLLIVVQFGIGAIGALANPAPLAPPAIARQLFDALYEAAGQYAVKKPDLEYTLENKRGAAYFVSRNAVVLEDKTYQLCRKMGKDSSAALAFVLGHELSHAFYRDAKQHRASTDFLAYDQHFESDIQSEKVADINGVFTAYLAGYRLSPVVPKFLPMLYEAYGLTGRVLKNYPPLEERARTAKEVLDITDNLIDLYETANYLLVAERYDLAITNYEYVLQYYQGRELFNNLGVLYLHQAMAFYQYESDRFVHPIELDAGTLLKKIEKARGPKEPTLQDKLERIRLLNKALQQFAFAIALDKHYTTAKINYATTLNLLLKPKEAAAYISKRKLPKKTKGDLASLEKLQLVNAISNALLGKNKAAANFFETAAKSETKTVAAAADFNLEVLYGKEPVAKTGLDFVFPAMFLSLSKAIRLPKLSHLDCLPLDEQDHCLRHLDEQETETFSFGNKRGNVLSIIRFKNKLAPELDLLELSEPLNQSFFYNLTATPNGFYLKSTDGSLVLKVGNDGNVEEMAKLIKH